MSSIKLRFAGPILGLAVALMSVLPPALGAARRSTEHPAPRAGATRAPLGAVFAQLKQAKWVTEGDSARIMYVFFDPNCPYCHRLYSVSQPFVRAGRVEMRWIPLGLLAPSSAGKAAAILEAKNAPAALAQNENGYHRPGGGGIAQTLPSSATQHQLDRNLALFHRAHAGVVPFILWEDRTGEVRAQAGAVDKETFAYLIRQIRPLHAQAASVR